MIKKSGKALTCEVTSVVFKDKIGIYNSIVSIVDLSKRQSNQEKINIENKKIVADDIAIAQAKFDSRESDNHDWITSVTKTTYDVIWNWDITIDEIYFGNNYSKVFGYKLPRNRLSFKEWIQTFLPKEGMIIKKTINKALKTGKKTWEIEYQFTCADQSVCQVTSRANILRDTAGKVIRIIGIMHDTSKMQKLENSHELEIRIKEIQMTEAVAEARETERLELARELHDNINQLLGASVLYLDMARSDINNVDVYLIHSLKYTRTAIDEIRKISKGLATNVIKDFGLTGAINNMSRDTMLVYPAQIHCTLDESLDDSLSDKFKLNAFRILQEQLNNIIKHAKASEICIRLSRTEPGNVLLYISDNGDGFDTTVQSKGIGISNIMSRAKQYHGDANIISQPGNGCTLTVNFPNEYADREHQS
jgi:signal transduction histidine kinase